MCGGNSMRLRFMLQRKNHLHVMLRCIYMVGSPQNAGRFPSYCGVKTMIDNINDVQKAGRENMGRTLESFGAFSRGWQTLASETAGFSRQAFEEGAAHFEKLLGAKSIDVAFEAQTEYLRFSYEKAVGQAARFGELYLDLVKDAAKPFEGAVPAVGRTVGK